MKIVNIKKMSNDQLKLTNLLNQVSINKENNIDYNKLNIKLTGELNLSNGDYYSIKAKYGNKLAETSYNGFVIFNEDENETKDFLLNAGNFGLLLKEIGIAKNIYSGLKAQEKFESILNKNKIFYHKFYKKEKNNFLIKISELLKSSIVSYVDTK